MTYLIVKIGLPIRATRDSENKVKSWAYTKKPRHVFDQTTHVGFVCVCVVILIPMTKLYSKFYQNLFWGFEATGSRNLAVVITLAVGDEVA